MSIAALCQGDQVIKQAASRASGAMGGPSNTWSDSGAALDCLIQTMGADELRKYNARGSKYHRTVFFSSDVALTAGNRLKWTVEANATLAVPVYLRVLDYYTEGRPGESMLWIADCEVETTRPEN